LQIIKQNKIASYWLNTGKNKKVNLLKTNTGMTTIAIRKKLANYMKVADDKKIKAMYALFEDEIEQQEMEYTNEFKAELDRRYEYYKHGGKMISAAAANKQISKILQQGKRN